MLDTPSTVAASICLLARWQSGTDDRTPNSRLQRVAATAVGMRHDKECGWCVYATKGLLAMVVEHNDADADGHVSARFRALPARAQRQLVDEAQAMPDEQVPLPATANEETEEGS